MAAAWVIRHRDETAGVDCPCGVAQRVLGAADNDVLSVHFVTVKVDSEVHYHRRLTEVYVVLEGEGSLELDGSRQPLRPGTVALIPPLVRHRAIPGPGGLELLNIVRPPFDLEDEHHD